MSFFVFLSIKIQFDLSKFFQVTLQHSPQLANPSAVLWAQLWTGVKCGTGKKGKDPAFTLRKFKIHISVHSANIYGALTSCARFRDKKMNITAGVL